MAGRWKSGVRDRNGYQRILHFNRANESARI
jgi:hypothetical protein